MPFVSSEVSPGQVTFPRPKAEHTDALRVAIYTSNGDVRRITVDGAPIAVPHVRALADDGWRVWVGYFDDGVFEVAAWAGVGASASSLREAGSL